MEIYEDWLSSKMTRSELNELCDEERTERKIIQKRKSNRKYRENNPEYYEKYSKNYREENSEQLKEKSKKYYENNREKVNETVKEYQQTPNGKKVNTLGNWKNRGLEESKEDLDRIYELYLTQELCNACDIKLTRDGYNSSTQASMDHDHITHRFRHIICHSCNSHDNWKKYFC